MKKRDKNFLTQELVFEGEVEVGLVEDVDTHVAVLAA
jgi:hypothetical protein